VVIILEGILERYILKDISKDDQIFKL